MTLLTGCAVVQVDVDVYKGPLSNQEEVQQQQLAVMATSAKPLLIRLRNQLEWHDPPWPVEAGDDYITTRKVWKSAYAKQVNDVLSLYKDALPPEVVQFERDTNEHLLKYSVDVAILRGSDDHANDGKVWSTFQSELRFKDSQLSPQQLLTDTEDSMKDGPCKTFEAQEGDYLTQGFRILLDSSAPRPDTASRYYNSDTLRQAIFCLLKDKSVPRGLPTDAAHLAPHLPRDLSSNALFRLLHEKSHGQYFASLLFKDPQGMAAQAFETRLATVSAAFLDARSELDSLLDLSLQFLHQLNGPGLADFDQSKPDVRQGTIHLIASLVQPQYMGDSLCVPWLQYDAVKARLLAAVKMRTPAGARWPPHDNAAAARLVETLLSNDPDGTSQMILTAGAVLRNIPADTPKVVCDMDIEPPDLLVDGEKDGNTQPRFLNFVKFGREFEHGLTRGPTLTSEAVDDFKLRTHASLQQIGAPAAGLERGRLAEGLETLAERYLQDSINCRDARRSQEDSWSLSGRAEGSNRLDPNCDVGRWVQERQSLGDSLVHFSEKLLFIANNDLLLAEKRTNRPDHSGQFVGAPVTEETTAGGDEGLTDQERRPYVLVLQSIGNSILNELDELRARRIHDGALGLRGQIELETLRRAYSPAPSQVLDQLVNQIGTAAQNQQQIASDKQKEKDGLQSGQLKVELTKAQTALTQATTDDKTASSALSAVQDQAKPVTLTYNTLTGDDDAQSKSDLSALRTAVVDSKTGDVDGPTLVDDVVTWLDGQVTAYDVSFQSDPRPARLAGARDYMKGHRKTMGPADTHPRADVFQMLAANISNNKAAADAAIASKQRIADAVAALVTADKAAVDTAQKALDAAQKDATSADSEIKKAQAQQAVYRDATKEIAARSNAILQGFPTDSSADPQTVYKAVTAALEKDRPAAGCPSPSTNSVCNALSAIKDFKPPLGASGIALVSAGAYGESENAEDVLDRLISALQYQKIRAASESDATGATAKGFQQAIDAAFEYRSGMAYLRPAGAYLRNSYPATSLQANPGLGWSNLLTQQATRTVPLIGGQLANRRAQDLQIQTEIDKQFWQNINSVRVAGAGRTNYVLAKDDIGNWYVKAYAADPQPIIDGAVGLAKFTLGAGSTASLPLSAGTGGSAAADSSATPTAAANVPAGIPATTTGSKISSASGSATPSTSQPQAPKPQSPLEKLYTLNATKYDTQTQAQYDHLRNDLGTSQIKASVTSAWTADKAHLADSATSTSLVQALNASTSVLDTTWKTLTDSKKSDEEASRILSVLNSLLSFRNTLNQKIGSSLTDAGQLKAAQQDLDQVVGPLLNREIATRQTAVKNFGTAIGFIGEALSPQP